MAGSCVHGNKPLGLIKTREFLGRPVTTCTQKGAGVYGVGKRDNSLRTFLPRCNLPALFPNSLLLYEPLPVGHLEDIQSLLGNQLIDDLYGAELGGWGELSTG